MRRLAGSSVGGRSVVIELQVRRFRCHEHHVSRQRSPGRSTG
ncbi:hypothetical protein OG390_43540 [Streptomyces sp. NBC_00996]|nr:hypothetical protein OG390_43540 [Streptomyces sp. NBC_00996]